MPDLKEWAAQRAERDQLLYEQYGQPLETEHTGEFVAIGPEGQIILGPTAGSVLRRAIDAFGSGNFALKRVGFRTFGRWLTATR